MAGITAATLAPIAGPFKASTVVASSTSSTNLAAGEDDSLMLKPDGTMLAWGDNQQGQLGTGNTTNASIPVAVPGVSGVTAIAAGLWHSMALKSDGTVLTWGDNANGQLGNGGLLNTSTPAPVPGLTGVTAISGGGAHSLALRSDGTVWAWGANYDGQLGNGSTSDSSTPVMVPGMSNVTAIAAGVNHSLALKSDGSVWAWGDNTFGQTGQPATSNCTTTSCPVPTPVLVNGISGATQIAAGGQQSVALKSDGTVWAWGRGESGGNDFGTHTNPGNVPIQAPGITGAVGIAAGDYTSYVRKSDGTAWFWGFDGAFIIQYVPGPTGGPRNAQAVNVGTSWPTPQQLQGLRSVSALAGGTAHGLALESDGSAWAWGNNVDGALGNGTNRASTPPTEVFFQAPPAGGSTAPQEVMPVANPAEPGAECSQGNAGDPVDTASGVFSEPVTDLHIAGRSYPLAFARTYNSSAAGADLGLGFGWQPSLGASLAVTGTAPNQVATITQETGATVTFNQPSSGNTWTPATPRIVAWLTDNPAAQTWTFVRGGTDTFTFNAAGQLTQMQDLNGYVTTLSYGSNGQLSTVTDPSGRTLTLTWNTDSPKPHIASVTDANVTPSRSVSYAYNDGNNDLTDVTDVNGNSVHYTYDTSHHLLTMRDPRGDTTTNHYDASGRVDWQKDGLGRQTSFAYSWTGPAIPASATTTVTDPAGNATLEQYQYGLLTSRTRGYGTSDASTASFLYDPETLACTEKIDPNGNATLYSLDANGNVLEVTDPLGRTERRTYNAFNQVLTDEDGNFVDTTYSYDARGNLTSVSRPLVGSSPAVSQTTVYNHADTSHPGDVTSMVDPDGKAWAYGYDAYGDRTSVVDPLGDMTTSTYNVDGWLTSSVSPKGNVAGCACAATYTTTYAHDNAGRPTVVTDPLGHSTRQHYDAAGRIDYVQDANQSASTCTTPPPAGPNPCTVNTYDAANELVAVTRADGTTATTEYNPDGTVLDLKDGRGNVLLAYGYDHQGRPTTVTDALGNTTTYGYNPAGNRITQMDPVQGATCTGTAVGCTSFTYDADNELSSVTYSDGVTPNITSISYDNDGQRTQMQTAQVLVTGTWTWDSLHRLTGYTDDNGLTVQYGYDLRNHVTSLTYPGAGHVVTNGYDDAGRWTSVHDWLGNTTTFGYDPNSNLTTETLPSGTSIVDSSTFDAANRMTSTTVTAGGTPVGPFPLSYTHDNVGQLTSDTGAPAGQGSYRYTALNQLCYAGSSSGSACSTPPAGATPFTYDQADNLVQMGSTTQQFNAADQLCWSLAGSSSGAGCGTTATPLGATAYQYDTKGNRTAALQPNGTTVHLGYDEANRLSSYAAGTTAATYSYEPTGLRQSKTVGGVTSQYLWDETGRIPLLLRDGTGANPVYYVYGPGDVPLEQISAPAITMVGSPATASDTGNLPLLTLTLPTGIAAGDQIIVATTYPAGVGNDVQAPAGYTQVGATANSGGTIATADVTKVFTKTAAGSEAQVTLTCNGSFAKAAVAAVYRGADAKVPIEVSAEGVNAGGTTVSASLNTRYPADQLVMLQGASYSSATTGTWAGPSGMTEQAQKDAGSTTVGLADMPFAGTGATGTLTSSLSTSGVFNNPPQLTGVLLALRTPPAVLFHHHDHLGSTRLLTDLNGAVAATYTYDPWGNITSQSAPVTASTPFLFAGEYRDAESGFYYLRARYYDPATAQFLTRDPMVATTRSPYGYVSGNPLNRTDPSGMIDQSFLSQGQIGQVNQTCSSWQNQSLCTQAAFCAEWTAGLRTQTGGSCRTIAEIAAKDYSIVEQGLKNAGPCGDVHLLNGYVATHDEAVRDLAETRAAFQVAVEGINFYNATNTCKARGAALAVAAGGTAGIVFDAIGYGGVMYYGWNAAMRIPSKPVTGGPGLTTAVVMATMAATQC